MSVYISIWWIFDLKWSSWSAFIVGVLRELLRPFALLQTQASSTAWTLIVYSAAGGIISFYFLCLLTGETCHSLHLYTHTYSNTHREQYTQEDLQLHSRCSSRALWRNVCVQYRHWSICMCVSDKSFLSAATSSWHHIQRAVSHFLMKSVPLVWRALLHTILSKLPLCWFYHTAKVSIWVPLITWAGRLAERISVMGFELLQCTSKLLLVTIKRKLEETQRSLVGF